MKGVQFNFIIAFVIVGLSFLLLPPDASAEDHTCYVSSANPNFIFSFYDVMPAGNRLDLIWRGKIKEEQRALIKTRYGRFYYEYTVNTDAETTPIGGDVLLCNNKDVISLP